MKQSTDRILTTHVGSLARPHSLLDIMKEREHDRPYDAEALDREIADAVKDRVKQQVESRHRHRRRWRDEQGQLPRLRQGSSRRLRGRHGESKLAPSLAGRVRHVPGVLHGLLQEVLVGGQPAASDHRQGPDHVHRSEAAADRHRQPQGGMRGPRRLRHLHAVQRPQRVRSRTSTTRSTRSTSQAVAEAMREEYLGIVEAGFILQVDDPWLIDMLGDPAESIENRASAPQHTRRGR